MYLLLRQFAGRCVVTFPWMKLCIKSVLCPPMCIGCYPLWIESHDSDGAGFCAGSHGYVDMQAHNSSALAERIRAVKRSPRYSLMLALREGAIRAPFDGVTVRNSSIVEWISRDTSKPGMLACNHQSHYPIRMYLYLCQC